ncbi:short chain dehydrogenase [Chryseobacterium sp. MOF25P]|nr:short chain dehydrogenase [Chryseobacterium sp. MOF25P]OBW46993.1 short chain dehydrogenase [Chryseobacterium sp. BGARF1]
MIKTIFITGASSGLGKVTGQLFQSNEWNVIATMRNPKKEADLNHLINYLKIKLKCHLCNSSNCLIKKGCEECFNLSNILYFIFNGLIVNLL